MVADTMTQMYDTMADTARATVEAGRKVQESWVDAVQGGCREGVTPDSMFAQTDKMTRSFFPMMGRAMHTANEAMNTAFQSNMDLMRVASDWTTKAADTDLQERTRSLWDAGFNAARTNIEAFNRAARHNMENWTAFIQSTGMTGNGDQSRPRTDAQKNQPKKS